ncbi:hypothetical protein BS78_09G102200 [Paspalum vaginatum]|nr:hypothetical protein BS78_09G102200 [Paspalum vaginatum]
MRCGRRDFARGSDLRASVSGSEAGMCGRGCFLRGADRLSAVKHLDKDVAGLQPFVDEAEAERLAKEAKRMQYLRKMARAKEHRDRQREAEDRIRDFDPKQGGEYYTRLRYVDLTKFDLDAESSRGPMRFTNAVYNSKDDYELCEGINIFFVRIATSDVGFPIHVYGTVIARDSLDKKCVYLFRCDRDHCQVINSEDESLILTGPKRGLALISENYIEIALKIKDHHGQDKELSKGILPIPGMERRDLRQCEVESGSLATRLSTVDVVYGIVKGAVEGTLSVEVLKGDFSGKITARTTSIPHSLVL